jgi:hypothetical protein
MATNAYEELHKRCYDLTVEAGDEDVHIILREVLRTLETVTNDMVKAWVDERTPDEIAFPTDHEYASGSWLAMLHASPLSPPEQS